MQELIEYYKKNRKLVLLASIIIFLLLTLISLYFNSMIDGLINTLPNGSFVFDYKEIIKIIISLLLSYVAPISVSYLIFSNWMEYIDKKRWKKKYPLFDISGIWNDYTTYTDSVSSKGWERVEIKNVPSPVIITQTCHKIQIEPSIGEKFKWKSLAADYSNKELHILYEVDYIDELRNQGFPTRRYGYERMTIDPNSLDNENRPTKMAGSFSHCAINDDCPIYVGDVVYIREYYN